LKTEYYEVGPGRYVNIGYDDDGRLSVVIKDGSHPAGETIIDVEVPANLGAFKDSFKPTVKAVEGVEFERI